MSSPTSHIVSPSTGEALLRGRELLFSVVNSAMDAIVTIDNSQRIVLFNPAAEKIFGYKCAEVLGNSIDILLPERLRAVHAAHVGAFGLSQVSCRKTISSGEMVGMRANGEEFPMESVISQANIDGQNFFTATLRDLTERELTLRDFERSQERLTLATESAHIGVWDWDIIENRLVWDEQMYALYGISKEDFVGAYEAWSQGLHPEDMERSEAELAAAVQGIKEFHTQFRVVWPNGEVRHLEAHGTVQRAEDGEPLRVTGVNWDITENKRIEADIQLLNAELEQRVEQRTAELGAANKELEAFSYSVSHDLRAPVRAILGFSRILREEHMTEFASESAHHFLQRIGDNAAKMGTLIDDLLAFSRLSRQAMNTQTVAPKRIVQEVWDNLETEREGRAVKFTIYDLPNCQIDPALLRQVFVNLLTNSLKFSRGRELAKIEVGAQDAEMEHIYFVRDNGVGFDMQYADKLFAVFQRLHRETEFEGTGVGLAIVQRVVHRYGGRAWAESELGQGATFYFSLKKEAREVCCHD